MRLVAISLLLSLAVTSCSLELEGVVYVTRDAGQTRDGSIMRDSGDAGDVIGESMDSGFDGGPDGSLDTGPDAHGDTPLDIAIDAPIDARVDVPHDVSTDDSAADVPAGDAGAPCTLDVDCVPYYCGCTACPSEAITCESPLLSCGLLCPSVCLIPSTVGCACLAGHCARMDVAATTCTTSSECSHGQLCCYPCGTAGCSNLCVDPDPTTHVCPIVL